MLSSIVRRGVIRRVQVALPFSRSFGTAMEGEAPATETKKKHHFRTQEINKEVDWKDFDKRSPQQHLPKANERRGGSAAIMKKRPDIRPKTEPKVASSFLPMEFTYQYHRWKEVYVYYKESITRPDFRLTLDDFNTVLSFLGRNGQYELAQNVSGELKRRGLIPTPHTYAWIIASCRGREQEALASWNDMLTQGLKPSALAYQQIMLTLGKCQKGDMALKYFRDMQSTPGMIIKPDVYAIVIGACGRKGMVTETESLIQAMKEAGHTPQVHCYNALMFAYAAAGDWQKALEVFHSLEPLKLIANSATYTALVKACCRAKEWEQAMIIHDRLMAKGVELTADYKTEVSALFEALGRHDEVATLDEKQLELISK